MISIILFLIDLVSSGRTPTSASVNSAWKTDALSGGAHVVRRVQYLRVIFNCGVQGLSGQRYDE